MIYEIRHYTLHDGKYDEMIARFREVNLPLFEKYGITVDRTWSHREKADAFSFIMSFSDAESRQTAWDGYHKDELFLAGREKQATIIAHIDWHVLNEITI